MTQQAKARLYLSSPHMGGDEQTLVNEAFATNWIAPLGPHVDAFEREFGAMLAEGEGEKQAEFSVNNSQLLGAEEKLSVNSSGGRQDELLVNSYQLLGKSAASAQTDNKEPITNNSSSASTSNPSGAPTNNKEPITNNLSSASPTNQEQITNNSSSIFCAALSSGTGAIHLALRMLGVGPGDEVFVSTLTFSASVNPICYEHARPVFIDSERQSWNMDPALLAEALADRAKKGKLPKAVILVHLYGQVADLGAIAGLCARYGVPLIEDAAEALGAVYYGAQLSVNSYQLVGKRQDELSVNSYLLSGTSAVGAPTNNQEQITDNLFSASPNNQELITNNQIPISPGTVGLMGIFSFNGNKIITTSGGGMLVSHDEALIKKARFLATQARDPAPHYQHSEIGFNYRMSNVLAAIGRGQLRVLRDRVNARRANCAFYQKAFADLPGIEFMPEAPWGRCTRWLTCILVDPAKFGADREKIRLALEAENIESRPVWKPMHLQPVFAQYDRFGGEVAEDLFNRGLCLPSGSNLSEGDLERVVAVVRGCRKG